MSETDPAAIDQRLAHEVEERKRAETALRFVADVTTALSESLDYEVTIGRVVHLAVPYLADWCLLDLLDERGVMRRVAAAHKDPMVEQILREIRERQKGWASERAASEIVAAGKSVIVPRMTDEILDRYIQDPEARALTRKLGVESGMGIPLIARGRSIGALSLCSNTPGRVYGPNDVLLAEELSRRAAVAIDNARLYREAQEAVRLRNDFLAVASHELKAPLAPMQMLVEELDREVRAGRPEALPHTVQTLRRQVHRLIRLVDGLMDVTEMQAGFLRLQRTPVDLVAVVKDAQELLAEELARARCPLTIQAPASLAGRWDRARLQQVITSLLANALKFGPHQPIELTVEEAGDRARLIVRDHGMGISPDRLATVFDRFERGVSARTYGGLGLGLYVVQQIVNAHEGTVTVESIPGAGAAFTVDLPREPRGE